MTQKQINDTIATILRTADAPENRDLPLDLLISKCEQAAGGRDMYAIAMQALIDSGTM